MFNLSLKRSLVSVVCVVTLLACKFENALWCQDLAGCGRPFIRNELLDRVQRVHSIQAKLDSLAEKTGRKDIDLIIMPTEQEASLFSEITRLKKENTKWLAGLVTEHGWLGKSLVGQDGSEAAWIIAQQASVDIDCQLAFAEAMNKLPDEERFRESVTCSLPEIRTELLERVEKDQDVRERLNAEGDGAHTFLSKVSEPSEKVASLLAEMLKSDRENAAMLEKIIADHGWPGKSLVGADGAHAAWMIVQHASHNQEFQKRCFAAMSGLPSNEVSLSDKAYLYDRIRIAEGKKQLFGTQIEFQKEEIVLAGIEDDADLARRRDWIGLPPMQFYLGLAKKEYGDRK